MKKILLLITGVFITTFNSFSQNWEFGGNGQLPLIFPNNQRIGPLLNVPFRLITGGQQRMHINPNGTTPNPNGLGGNINTSGFLGLNTITPASRLHISGDNNSPLGGFRNWMRDGILISNNSDNMYIGLWHSNPGNPNQTDAVINWGDDDANNQGPDNLRFVFTSYPASGLPSAGQNGLETMRMTYEGFVGVGDFATLNLSPTHSLDVNGNARVRNVPIAGAPQSLIIGQQVGGGNDRELQRLDFTGNANEVLLGNGTWGPATPNVIGNNGIFINNGEVQLGAPCNSFLPLIFSRFTESRAVWLNGNSFWMYSSAAQTGGVGFGAQPASAGLCGVGNTVEISANNQSVYGNTNASGLRFTKLTSLSPTIANGVNGVDNSKVLTVDQNGDVVLTDNLITGIGNYCGQTQNPLTDNYEIPMDGFNYNYTDAAATPSSMFLGFPTCQNIPARFGVFNDVHTTAGYFATDANVNALAIGVATNVTNTTGDVTGVTATVETDGVMAIGYNSRNVGTNSTFNIGYNALVANGTSQSFAVNADVINSSSPYNYGYQTEVLSSTDPNATNFGVHSIVNSPGFYNYGGYYNATGADNNIGIYAQALPNSNSSTVPGPNFAGYFNGDVNITGHTYGPSDINIKNNIDTLINAFSIISYLNAVEFEFNDYSQTNSVMLPSGQQLGFIAQEVEQILPNLVNEVVHPDELDSLGNVVKPGMTYKGVNYEQIIPVAIQGIKELNAKVDSLDNSNLIDSLVQVVDSLNTTVSNQQNQITNLENEVANQTNQITNLENENATQQNQIDDLTNRLDQLENCLGNLLPILCQINNAAINQNDGATQKQLMQTMSLELNDGENIVLEQNVPNPFNEQTVINYFIPESIGSASIVFYNRDGKLIKQQDITTRGNGRINVYGYDLSSGLYTYSLIADGQVVATKKMVKVN